MLLVDTGVLVGAANRADSRHSECAAVLNAGDGPLVVPVLVVAEVGYLLQSRLGARAELSFAEAVENGELVPEPVHSSDWKRMTELMEGYIDLPLGIVDASVIAAAERLHLTEVASLDHRHLSTVRPRHTPALILRP